MYTLWLFLEQTESHYAIQFIIFDKMLNFKNFKNFYRTTFVMTQKRHESVWTEVKIEREETPLL